MQGSVLCFNFSPQSEIILRDGTLCRQPDILVSFQSFCFTSLLLLIFHNKQRGPLIYFLHPIDTPKAKLLWILRSDSNLLSIYWLVQPMAEIIFSNLVSYELELLLHYEKQKPEIWNISRRRRAFDNFFVDLAYLGRDLTFPDFRIPFRTAKIFVIAVIAYIVPPSMSLYAACH